MADWDKVIQKAEDIVTPEVDAVRLLKRHREINRAFGQMYFAIYSVDLVSGQYLEVSTLDIFREYIPPRGDNQLLFDMVAEHYVTEPYQAGMRAFLSMDTLQERLAGRNSLGCEFYGTTQGWCRANFVVENRDADGRVLRFVYVTQEINQEKKLELERIERLNRAYAEAEAANRAKSDFLSRMSHDIRTPLNAIMGFTSLIDQKADDPAHVREYAAKIMVSGNLLLSLLNEILDMTKIENGEAAPVSAPFLLDDMLSDLDVVIRSQTDAKGQRFIIEREDLRHGRLVGDRVCTSRVLFNILSNAVKYTPQGGDIRFAVREEQADDGNGVRVVFRVRDTGPGIAPEYRERVFEPFFAARDGGSDTGAGLGLPIAKRFTELMGGEIRFESGTGGTEFTVSIPFQTREETPPAPPRPAAPDDVLAGLHVLVVEDNEYNREILTELLSLAGMTCDQADGGPKALELMEQAAPGTYDLIIMDVRMPHMDGYETTRRIRALPREDAKTVPVIALTANAFAEDVEKALAAGMNAHLAKPLDMDRLRRTARELLHRGE